MPSTNTYDPAGAGPVSRQGRKYTVRRWSVRNARFLEWLYIVFADMLLDLHPLWKLIGYQRIEGPMVFIEKHSKGFLFDCRMCGQCVLSSTGMACPMNCPKLLRNGPCGGVRSDGNCEVEPDMPCVWTEAWKGSQLMKNGDAINTVQLPHDQSLRGTSSWLRATAEKAAQRKAMK
ncbi:MAG: methylenetetrahydrofolate reductase C-terminal domain-containing protein [Rhodospirillaceae bacterium]|nr:methylenetetrahydrofolate reductase C-terminal domain-containing protein [Rhodospirillaceae bacterium]